MIIFDMYPDINGPIPSVTTHTTVHIWWILRPTTTNAVTCLINFAHARTRPGITRELSSIITVLYIPRGLSPTTVTQESVKQEQPTD